MIELAAPLVRGWIGTLRASTLYRGEMKDGALWSCDREIYAVLERDLLAILPFTRRFRFLTMIALGRDGDRAAALAETLGCEVVRGSSRRGGDSAAVAFAKALDSWEGPAVISVDGPLGPAGSVKPGAILLAAGSGRALRPVAAASRRSIRVPRTWAGIEVPLPFTTVLVAAGDSRTYALPMERTEIDGEAKRIEAEMQMLRSDAIAAVRKQSLPGSARPQTRAETLR